MALPTSRVDALVAAFVRISATRMAGLGLSHPLLRVEAVGFRDWEQHQIGVLVTPWAMNLVVLAADGADAAPLKLGPDRRQAWRFPSGEYDLMGGEEPECGAFQCCSLFSPMHEFADQAAAVATAAEIMRALFAPGDVDDREKARATGDSVLQAPVSRRGFLRGILAQRG